MTLGQLRLLQAEHEEQDANQGRERALIARAAQHHDKKSYERLLSDLYGTP